MISSLYKGIRSISSFSKQARMSRLVFDLGLKPSVGRSELTELGLPGNARGGMIVSLDFEMAWAFRYSKRTVDPLDMARLERENIPVLLSFFDEFGIPATWATVGHLFLESCRKGDHDWMRRMPHFDDHWKYTSGDWFDHDPSTDYRKDKAWYAPDLIEQILNSSVSHEFGCHTFSHIDCSDKNCPAGVLDDEIKACKIAARKWGIDLKSFVFPGGTAGNYSVLKEHGFKIYRKKMKHGLAYPLRDDHGMLATPSTSGFGRGYDWEARYYIQRFCNTIDKAIRAGVIAHFWTHPSVDKWTLNNVIPHVFRYASELRQKGNLWIGTMGQIADYIELESR